MTKNEEDTTAWIIRVGFLIVLLLVAMSGKCQNLKCTAQEVVYPEGNARWKITGFVDGKERSVAYANDLKHALKRCEKFMKQHKPRKHRKTPPK